MYVYVCVYVCMCMLVMMLKHTYVYACMYVYKTATSCRILIHVLGIVAAECMYVCVYVYIHLCVRGAWAVVKQGIYIHTYTHIRTRSWICMHTYIYTHIHTSLREEPVHLVAKLVCVNIHIHMYTYTYTHTRACICMHTCTHTYIHTRTPKYTHTYLFARGACASGSKACVRQHTFQLHLKLKQEDLHNIYACMYVCMYVCMCIWN